MRILLVNPPFYGSSGPYPATCYLKGFLKTVGVSASQYDANIAVILRLFSAEGLADLRAGIADKIRQGWDPPPRVQRFLEDVESYERSIDTAILVLQGRDQGAVARALKPGFFPPPLNKSEAWAHAFSTNLHALRQALGPLTPDQAQRAAAAPDVLQMAFGKLGGTDRARFLASGLIADVLLVMQAAVEEDFQFDDYLKGLTDRAETFADLGARLEGVPNLIDRKIDEVATDLVLELEPDVVGWSVPFGGNLYGALRMARIVKQLRPDARTIMGGGYVNTVLRSVSDPAVFDYIDYITLDDGEAPLRCIIEMIQGKRSADELVRTFARRDGEVVFVSNPLVHDIPSSETGVPTYEDLPLGKYLLYWPSLTKPQTIWERRWNKLTIAHGCYWRKCAFCDTRLDYVARYDPSSVDVIIERITTLVSETGESGFHFVDEALPPALLRKLALRLIAERIQISWWGNARFDKSFVAMAPLLAESGCIAITGGLETASDRLLKLMAKGVSLEQVARVTKSLSQAGLFVHAYLIYGFPTQTVQETVDALEFVRQLFAENCIQSAVWARFFLTEFSPIAAAPDQFGVTITSKGRHPFGNSCLDYEEAGGVDHGQFTDGLHAALDSYLHGFGWDRPVHEWFGPGTVLPATLPGDFVTNAVGGLYATSMMNSRS